MGPSVGHQCCKRTMEVKAGGDQSRASLSFQPEERAEPIRARVSCRCDDRLASLFSGCPPKPIVSVLLTGLFFCGKRVTKCVTYCQPTICPVYFYIPNSVSSPVLLSLVRPRDCAVSPRVRDYLTSYGVICKGGGRRQNNNGLLK